MTDASSASPSESPRKVSMSKKPAGATAAGSSGPGGAAGTAGGRRPPRQVVLACAAIVIAVLAALATAALLHSGSTGRATAIYKDKGTNYKCTVPDGSGVQKWVYQGLCNSEATSNMKAKAKDRLTSAKLFDHVSGQVDQAQKGILISTLLFGLVLALVAWAAYRGRYWARWGVLGVWFVSTLTGTVYGISSLLAVGSSGVPGGYKAPAFVAALMLLVAVVLTNLRPSAEYFALSRPAPRPGQPARRGLFAPRPPAGGSPARPRGATKASATVDASADTTGAGAVDRSRTKKRTNTAAVAKGAELARTRAKAASKSRRTDG